MSDRLYSVKPKKEDHPKLRMVQAGSKAQVASFLVSDLFDIEVADAMSTAEFFATVKDAKVEKVK